jgi:ribose transport system ATP-binding protein
MHPRSGGAERILNDNVLLEARNITKFFFNVRALHNVSLSVGAGEVHCIVGENGSGKSTLMKVLAGVHQPNSGEILFEGSQIRRMTPDLSQKLGIQVVYQEPIIEPNLTVAENIFLGILPGRGGKAKGFVRWKAVFSQAQKIIKELGISLDVHEKPENISVADVQIMQILKALAKNPKVMIMDEPTASFGRNETVMLHDLIRRLKKHNIGIVYISHHLEDVLEIADRTTVIRDGDVIAEHVRDDLSEQVLIHEMVGRNVEMFFRREHFPIGETVLEAKNISGSGVHNASFVLKRGEVLGVGGMVGAKRTELMELIFGAKKMKSGSVTCGAETYVPAHPYDSIRRGICMITEERQRTGLNLHGLIRENIVVSNLKKLKGFPFINRNDEIAKVQKLCHDARIKCDSIEDLITSLSGGNQQKVVLAKWLFAQPRIYIFDEPTKGIDIGAKEEIFKLIVQLCKEGNSVIMVSSDMLELLAVSDRIIVMANGRVTGELEGDDVTEENVMSLAILGGDDK